MKSMLNVCLFINLLIGTSCYANEHPTEITEFSFILKPSTNNHVGGVGVFAAHDILKGTPLRRNYPGKNHYTKFRAKIKDIPKEFLKYVVYINEEECYRPEMFDRMEIMWFLNHSNDPNTTMVEGKRTAVRDILAGEEITMDYNELNEPDSMKEPYYLPH